MNATLLNLLFLYVKYSHKVEDREYIENLIYLYMMRCDAYDPAKDLEKFDDIISKALLKFLDKYSDEEAKKLFFNDDFTKVIVDKVNNFFNLNISIRSGGGIFFEIEENSK